MSQILNSNDKDNNRKKTIITKIKKYEYNSKKSIHKI